MNFRVDFGAEDEVRLSPFKDDNPKDTENSTFESSSLLVVKATVYLWSNEKLIFVMTIFILARRHAHYFIKITVKSRKIIISAQSVNGGDFITFFYI